MSTLSSEYLDSKGKPYEGMKIIAEVWGRSFPALLGKTDFSTEEIMPLQCSTFLQ